MEAGWRGAKFIEMETDEVDVQLLASVTVNV
jgi:hypothetical protein